MEYFNLLEFKKEPFSNSPEPEFLFASPQHNNCLQRIELAVRLRRGLNIVIGAVGTGKTTLCRKLIQQLSVPATSDSPDIETFLLLDPAVESRLSFVKTVASILGISDISVDDHEWQIKEKIKTFLFEQGVQDQKNIVLIIDEGQKIPDDCLEILREFLNYETNSFKLLQIVIFAQPEFHKSLVARANLLDRVNSLYHLQPFSFRQTKAMIEYRISVASQDPSRQPLFTFGGLLAVYFATAGYPRKVVSLCHQVLLMLIIRGKSNAGWFLVRRCMSKIPGRAFNRVTWAALGFLTLAAALVISSFFYWHEPTKRGNQAQNQRILSGIDIHKESLMPPSTQMNSGEDHAQMDNIKPPGKIPDYLGTIPIKKRMTIWHMLENIYGDSGAEIKHRLLVANPRIKNINAIVEGEVIHLPAIPANALPLKKDMIIVALENSNDVAMLYRSLLEKTNHGNPSSLRLLSYWNKRQGKQFAIALDKRFKSMEDAKEAIRRLPSGLAVSARVLSQWDGDTVFFNSRFYSN
jgi:general secretion pathway protein A